MVKTATIPVTVAKAHLISLGERMYVDAIELLRELVANAYDADATEVHVEITSHAVVVRDDGSGMDDRGLAQYFEVGSAEKRNDAVSPTFGRKRIGQFGIGKFAALAAADRFTIETVRRGVRRTVTFDKRAWQAGNDWKLPVSRASTDASGHGTLVRLEGLRRRFSAGEVERFLRDAVSLRAKRFTVSVNGRRLSAKAVPGRIVPLRQPTLYGMIEGEFVIAANPRDIETPGVECRVRGALIRRESFGLEQSYPSLFRRVTGSIEADFLPVITARTDFVRDSPAFQLFGKVVRASLEHALRGIMIERDKRDETKLREELREAVEQLRRALKEHPELVPSGRVVEQRRRAKEGMAAVDTIPEERRHDTTPDVSSATGAAGGSDMSAAGSVDTLGGEGAHHRTPSSGTATAPPQKRPLTSVTRELRVAKLGVTVAFTHLGADGPEAVTEGNLIYINEDHPTYQHSRRHHAILQSHLMRLLTQEVALLKFPKAEVRDAFAAQSTLLRDALEAPQRRRR